MAFEVFQSPQDRSFFFHLKASNGKIMLQSEASSSLQASWQTIGQVQKNTQNPGNFNRKTSSDKKFYFLLHDLSGELLGQSQEYTTKAGMEKGIQWVVANAPNAVVVDLTQA